jgi:16S rRNA processing protein RimM
MAQWDDMAVVGRIARPHGIRGQVIVNPDTDFPEQRFRKGASFWIRSSQGDERLTIGSVRFHGGRPVIGFERFERVEDVERLAGVELRVPEEELTALEPGLFYHHQLVGCVVEMPDGAVVGTVSRIEGGLGGSRLVVDGRRGEILVPLATEICVDIDVGAKRIRIEPPEGLLDLNVSRR